MPTNKNAMSRYAIIDALLANRYRAFSIQEIADKVNAQLAELGQNPVSKRCVEKDISYLENESPFCVELEEFWVDALDKNDRPYRKRCIRYSDPTYSIFKPKLTDDEKAILASALYTLGSFDGLENFGWLNDLKSRLQLIDQEPIISLSKNLIENTSLIAQLFTAIRNKIAVGLAYHKSSNEQSGQTTLSPYLLKEYNRRWYLIGGAADSGRILTFALDQIDALTLLPAQIYKPCDVDLNERFDDIIGITFVDEAPLLKIRFWVSDTSKGYVATKPLHASQISLGEAQSAALRLKNPDLRGGAFFSIECRQNYELIRELCSFGGELKVLSPEPIVAAVVERIKRLSATYGL